jgi:putative transposase
MLREGARYHVSARVNRREMIFSEYEIKKLFLSVLKASKAKFNFIIENICLMGNHVHFIIRPVHGNSLSEIMKWILGVFAIRYNRYRRLTGHVWGERFYSKIIENMREYREIFAYIDANPIIAGLVSRAEDWLFGRFHLSAIGFGEILENPVAFSDLS